MKKLLMALCLLSTSVFADHFVVELKTGFTKKDIQRLKSYQGVKEFSKFTNYRSEYFDRLFSVELQTKDQLTVLENDNAVALVESDFTPEFFEIRINPKSKMVINDMLLPQQWGLFNQDQVIEKNSIGGNKIYVYAKEGVDINWHKHIDKVEAKLKKNPVVAVIDMGIDFDHPELKDSIYKNTSECDENGEMPADRTVDRDGNKLPADCHGWNFAATSAESQYYPLDDKGHGTHVSGIIAAKRNNDVGIGGVSDKIKILPIRVTGGVDESAERNNLLIRAPSKRIANGILYAVRMNVDVINLSLGWPKSMDTKFMRQVFAEAIQKGIVVVAAAGNDNSTAGTYPCNYYDVICVGSVDIDGNVSNFSNHGGHVDLLAPGDQIVSTIPKSFIPIKLNIQGYDILSGTSQAAPFVSATAAMLRGVDPTMSLDEIKRRLYVSARAKENPTKSLKGLLNFGEVFEVNTAPVVLPVFKELKTLEVNAKDGIFKFPLYLKNYGENTDQVKASLRALNDGVDILAVNPATTLYEKGKPAPLYVTGQVKNFSADRSLKLELTLDVAGEVQKYFHSITLGISIDAVPKMNFGFKFRDKIKPIVTFNEEKNEYTALLDTVDEEFAGETLPSYYLSKKIDNEEEKAIELDLFHFDGRGFREAKQSLKIENALKFLSIKKQDYNYDGKKDILVKTINCRKDCERQNIPEEDLYIQFSYRDLDFEPLFGEFSDLRFTAPEGINITPKTVRHYKAKLPNGMFMAMPIFVTEGVTPEMNDQNNIIKASSSDQVSFIDTYFEDDFLLDMFKPKRKVITRNVYYLALNPASKELEPKTFMDKNFDLAVKTKMEQFLNKRVSLVDSFINVVQLLHQSRDDYYADQVHAMFSFGLGGYQYNFVVEISEGVYSINPTPQIDRSLLGNSHHEFIQLDDATDRDSADSFVSFLTSKLITIVGITKDNQQIALPYRLKKDDLIMGFLGMFKQKEKLSLFLEQVDTVSLITVENGVQKVSASPTDKFSFLAGHTMTELYYPVVARERTSAELSPAIYVDNTAISSNQVYLSTEIEEKLISPIRTSFYVPEKCKAKNPILGKDGFYLFTFVCLDENGFRLKFVDMIK